MESDKILVMDAGKVVEFAPPLALLQIPDGHFTRLLSETGPASFNALKAVAEKKAEREGNRREAFDLSADSDNIIISSSYDQNLIKTNKSTDAQEISSRTTLELINEKSQK